jgi:hypothetical protein
MGIPLNSQFTVGIGKPIDDRMSVADITARDAILVGRRYLGMQVFVVADTKTYTLKIGLTNSDWVEFGAGTSGGGVSTSSPQVTLGVQFSELLSEKGEVFPTTGLSVSVVQGTDPIARIQIFRNSVEIADFNPPTITGSGLTAYTDTTPMSDTTEYVALVTTNGGTIPSEVITASKKHLFVYPFYHGSYIPGSPVDEQLLTKDIIAEDPNIKLTFTNGNVERLLFLQLTSLQTLSSILDESSNETFNDWSIITVQSVLALDGTIQDYYVYEMGNTINRFRTSIYTLKNGF